MSVPEIGYGISICTQRVTSKVTFEDFTNFWTEIYRHTIPLITFAA